MNEGDAYSKERMQQEMELQLHQQYAENNNANLGSIVTLIVALLAVFAGYGYVYLHSTLEFSCEFKEMYDGTHFTLDAVLLTATAAYVVLGIMYYICVSQGMKQRMEQFVTFAIRAKYYARNVSDKPIDRKKVSGLSIGTEFPESLMSDSYLRVFPPEYHPFKEGKEDEKKDAIIERRVWKLTQGLFGDLLPVVMFAAVLLAVSLLLRFFVYDIEGLECSEWWCLGILAGTFISIWTLLWLNNIRWRKRYNDRFTYYHNVMKQSYKLWD